MKKVLGWSGIIVVDNPIGGKQEEPPKEIKDMLGDMKTAAHISYEALSGKELTETLRKYHLNNMVE